jgi:hypothetical protein
MKLTLMSPDVAILCHLGQYLNTKNLGAETLYLSATAKPGGAEVAVYF